MENFCSGMQCAWKSNFGHRALGIWHRASGIGNRASGIGHRESGIGNRASGMENWLLEPTSNKYQITGNK
ncbi:hypothetical protein [Microcoleus sp. B13-B6]|uniref:hypothetical protein n=1 Tax=Microcoleus sp. B13-B6 TaxID=2818652 RepID=UPI002FD30F48